MTADISIYLLHKNARITHALSDMSEWTRLPIKRTFAGSLDVHGFVKQAPPSPPKWLGWLRDVFDFSHRQPATQSAGLLAFLSISSRTFVLAFGTGWQALAKSTIERDFGLVVALNQVRADLLQHLVTKTINLRSRERSTYHYAGADLNNFDLDIDVEWLRSASGKTTRRDCSLIAGSDALKLRRYTGDFASLGALCRELLPIYAQGVPAAFDFVENLRPIRSSDALHTALEADLKALLEKRPLPTSIEVILDATLGEQFHTAELRHRGHHAPLSDLSRSSLAAALDQLTATVPLSVHDVILKLTDSDGQQVHRDSLLNVVQAEISRGGKTYVRLERQWFSVGQAFLKQIDARVGALPNATGRLALPPWPEHLDEEAYNRLAAATNGWLCQDRQMLHPGSGAEVEPCDLLTRDWDFIHVKRGDRATSVHHQLGQLSGAATLLQRDAAISAEMQRRYSAKWPNGHLAAAPPRFVAAIARKSSDKDLFGKMLLPKINILEHARRVRSLGYEFAVARIDIQNETPPTTTNRVPKPPSGAKKRRTRQ